jgi:cyclophilin family peptidyl-prolyl cis-trans isomerase
VKSFLPLLAGFILCLPTRPAQAGTFIEMNTSLGALLFELYDLEKPATVQLFLNWLDQGNYAGTYVHRATAGYLAQGGRYGIVDLPGFGRLNVELPIAPDGSVVNEINNGNFIPNTYGTLAMVPWTPSPGATQTYVTSGFVMNFNTNPALDDPGFGGGFPVFGRLVDGWQTFALLNPTNGNPAAKAVYFSDTLPELLVRTNANPAAVTFDDLIYLNLQRSTVPEPDPLTLLAAAAALLAVRVCRPCGRPATSRAPRRSAS